MKLTNEQILAILKAMFHNYSGFEFEIDNCGGGMFNFRIVGSEKWNIISFDKETRYIKGDRCCFINIFLLLKSENKGFLGTYSKNSDIFFKEYNFWETIFINSIN